MSGKEYMVPNKISRIFSETNCACFELHVVSTTLKGAAHAEMFIFCTVTPPNLEATKIEIQKQIVKKEVELELKRAHTKKKRH